MKQKKKDEIAFRVQYNAPPGVGGKELNSEMRKYAKKWMEINVRRRDGYKLLVTIRRKQLLPQKEASQLTLIEDKNESRQVLFPLLFFYQKPLKESMHL